MGAARTLALTLSTLLLLLGCAASPPAAQAPPPAAPSPAVSPASLWSPDLGAALAEARASGRPLLVVSLLGDLERRC